MVIINSHDEFASFEGKEIGVSDYLTITQERINQFAEATLDYQWIHTDPERASKESPFRSPIAHGYLTLSVVPHLWGQIIEIRNLKMMVNYGIESLRFNQAVVVGSDVRLKVRLKSIANLRGVSKALLDIELEIKNSKKPAYKGTMVFLYHFEN